MDDADADSYIFKRQSKAITMIYQGNISEADSEDIQIDASLLFQHLQAAATTAREDMEDTHRFKLSSFPTALFKLSSLPRQPDKVQLAKAIWKLAKAEPVNVLSKEPGKYVIDGGWLLQHISWKTGNTFEQICNSCVSFMTQKYSNTSVVFDGYTSGLSTKDVTQVRLTKGIQCLTVDFILSIKLQRKKED
jgi:hypothetical protein